MASTPPRQQFIPSSLPWLIAIHRKNLRAALNHHSAPPAAPASSLQHKHGCTPKGRWEGEVFCKQGAWQGGRAWALLAPACPCVLQCWGCMGSRCLETSNAKDAWPQITPLGRKIPPRCFFGLETSHGRGTLMSAYRGFMGAIGTTCYALLSSSALAAKKKPLGNLEGIFVFT